MGPAGCWAWHYSGRGREGKANRLCGPRESALLTKGQFRECFTAPLRGACISLASSQGGASLALGYSRGLPTGGVATRSIDLDSFIRIRPVHSSTIRLFEYDPFNRVRFVHSSTTRSIEHDSFIPAETCCGESRCSVRRWQTGIAENRIGAANVADRAEVGQGKAIEILRLVAE